MSKYLNNSFSLQMLGGLCMNVVCTRISERSFKKYIGDVKVKSCIGHKTFAELLGVDYNRCNIKVQPGDVVFVAQYVGGRLPEGAKTLPVNSEIFYYKLTFEDLGEI